MLYGNDTQSRLMNGQPQAVKRPSGLVPFGEFLEGLGKSEVTGWRWRRAGVIQTINIYGKIYISVDEIRRFEGRACAGEFSRNIKPPHPAT
jgi:hypothetical protein